MVFVELKISRCADDQGFVLVSFVLYCFFLGGGVVGLIMVLHVEMARMPNCPNKFLLNQTAKTRCNSISGF
jgi:hypothetical protein